MPAAGANFVRASAFVSGACANGQQIKCLTIGWAGSIRSHQVIENWRHHCNAVRPHNSRQYLTAHAFKPQHHSSPSRAVFQK